MSRESTDKQTEQSRPGLKIPFMVGRRSLRQRLSDTNIDSGGWDMRNVAGTRAPTGLKRDARSAAKHAGYSRRPNDRPGRLETRQDAPFSTVANAADTA